MLVAARTWSIAAVATAAVGCAALAGVEDGELASSTGGGGGADASAGSGGSGNGGSSGAAGSGGGVAGADSGTGGTAASGGAPNDSGTGGAGPDPYFTAVMADSPIAYFRFAEPSGAVAKNEVTGSSLTATYPLTGAARGVPGIRSENAAIRFEDVKAMLPVLGGLDFPGDTAFSLEFWIQVDDLAASGRFFEQITANPGKTGTWLGLWKPSNQVRTETWASEKHIFYTLSATAPPKGQFIHIVFLHRVGEKDHLYVNGAEHEGFRLKPGDRLAVNKPFQFGDFIGVLDEFAVYDKDLSTTQIAKHLSAQAQ